MTVQLDKSLEYDNYLKKIGRLTTAEAENIKKGDALLWYCRGIYDNKGVEKLSFGWKDVKFDSKRNEQSSPMMIVKYAPDNYVNVYYHDLKLPEIDVLFERWN